LPVDERGFVLLDARVSLALVVELMTLIDRTRKRRPHLCVPAFRPMHNQSSKGEGLRYTISDEWLPKVLGWIKSTPSSRYDSAMGAEGLFQVEPTK
jgi:hypothetical protein